MGHLNVEIKARCSNPVTIRAILRSHGAEDRGIDHQVDTYFNVRCGRLKLREGTIENALIYYEREDILEPKQSHVILYQAHPTAVLKDILTKALGIRVIVEKRREIYALENIKFHIDTVHNLGSFVEIEAIDRDGTIGPQQLRVQCQSLCDRLDIGPEDFVSGSYSDLLLCRRESVTDPAQC